MRIFASHSVRTAHARTHTHYTYNRYRRLRIRKWPPRLVYRDSVPRGSGLHENVRREPRGVGVVSYGDGDVSGGGGTSAQLAPATVFSSVPPPLTIRPRAQTVQYY